MGDEILLVMTLAGFAVLAFIVLLYVRRMMSRQKTRRPVTDQGEELAPEEIEKRMDYLEKMEHDEQS
jgi:hypothetical protein